MQTSVPPSDDEALQGHDPLRADPAHVLRLGRVYIPPSTIDLELIEGRTRQS